MNYNLINFFETSHNPQPKKPSLEPKSLQTSAKNKLKNLDNTDQTHAQKQPQRSTHTLQSVRPHQIVKVDK